MKQQNVFGKPNDHSAPPERQARIHRHGSLIFLGQILVLGSVPFLTRDKIELHSVCDIQSFCIYHNSLVARIPTPDLSAREP